MSDDLEQVKRYRELVLEYEALDEQVDSLLAAHHGATETMSSADYKRYRQLAHRRDVVHNQMKALEQQLLGDSNED